MKFIFEWKKDFTSERSEKINFTCSSQHVTFFLLHNYECFENYSVPNKGNGKYVTRVPDVVSYEIYEWRFLQ